MYPTSAWTRCHGPGLALVITGALSAACAPQQPAADGSADPSSLPVLSVSDTPSLQIGLVSGDEHYLFDQIVSVRRTTDGDILVADGRANRISVFDSEGHWLRSWGRQGDGPGEFRWLSRVYLTAPHGVLALDGGNGRLSRFDDGGTFQGTERAEDLSGDSVFSMDVWLHRRFLVDGALVPAHRQHVRDILDGLPSPGGNSLWREVRTTASDALLIREPDPATPAVVRWIVIEEGAPTQVLELPAALDPQDVRLADGELLGRWKGSDDVNFVREYRLQPTGDEMTVPPWLASSRAAPDAASASPDSVDIESLRTAIRGALKQMATAQEIYYSRHYTYTTERDSLMVDLELPEGLSVDVLQADTRGMSVVAAHSGLDRICVMGYGASAPPGWTPGVIICAP